MSRLCIPVQPRNHFLRSSLYVSGLLFLVAYLLTIPVSRGLTSRFHELHTAVWQDRNDTVLPVGVNDKGHFIAPTEATPPLFEELLLKKEDRYFYYHPGVNPVSMLRGAFAHALRGKSGGSSTLTQQLVKILLDNESERTVRNKLVESLAAMALELHTSKREILSMYVGAAYFGKNRQGLAEASRHFFNKDPSALNESEVLQLITAIGSPATRYPGSERNQKLLPLMGVAVESDVQLASTTLPGLGAPSTALRAPFELKAFHLSCDPCEFTVDAPLTERIRAALKRRIDASTGANVRNGAVVIIKLPENELLAIVGSPDTASLSNGSQLNMAIEPRPIGSTIKPFIYLNAFEKGARPYTLIDDEEYNYKIGTGFVFYPKNFDGKFRGTVTLHSALSNSLNVPAVKVLEYVGLRRFYSFLEDKLGFMPRQPLERYELGIALGALEMDLLTLSHYFTLFPQNGVLLPLIVERNSTVTPPMQEPFSAAHRVADPEYVELVNRILSDREAAVEQFGLRSNLTLPYKNYALKTGTSGNYHDSWTLGFTPDFLVGVWLGNSDNQPMRELTGQTGAGAVWQDVMLLMYGSKYNKNTRLSFPHLKEFTDSGSIEFGLPGDDYEATRAMLRTHSLILSPHNGDVIELERNTVIPLKARKPVEWYANGSFLGSAVEFVYKPSRAGTVEIKAVSNDTEQSLSITLVKPD